MRAVSSRASRGVLYVLLAHLAWRPGNHTDGDVPEQRMPVGRWAEVSRPSPRTTFYPCQSIGELGTQYCLRQRRHDNRSSEAPHLSKRWVITRSLHGHFTQLASDISARRISLGYLRPMRRSPALRHHPPPVACNPGAPSRRRRSPPARLALRLERFQACALRNHPTLHVPPESDKQATGQGHNPNAPHALASQSKAGIEPDAEGGVGLIT